MVVFGVCLKYCVATALDATQRADFYDGALEKKEKKIIVEWRPNWCNRLQLQEHIYTPSPRRLGSFFLLSFTFDDKTKTFATWYCKYR